MSKLSQCLHKHFEGFLVKIHPEMNRVYEDFLDRFTDSREAKLIRATVIMEELVVDYIEIHEGKILFIQKGELPIFVKDMCS